VKFLAAEFRDDGEYCVTLEAANWAAAEKVCDANGWKLKGRYAGSVDAGAGFGEAEADALIAQHNSGGLN
jgi:hypothetical protein